MSAFSTLRSQTKPEQLMLEAVCCKKQTRVSVPIKYLEKCHSPLNYQQTWRGTLALSREMLGDPLAPRYQLPRCLARFNSTIHQVVLAQITRNPNGVDSILPRLSAPLRCTMLQCGWVGAVKAAACFSERHAQNTVDTKRQPRHATTLEIFENRD